MIKRLKTWLFIFKKGRVWKRRHPEGSTMWKCGSPTHTCSEDSLDCSFYFPSAKDDTVGAGSLFPCKHCDEWVLFRIVFCPNQKKGETDGK